MLIAGRSGAGKSTLAAALHAAGHPLVADDVAVVARDGWTGDSLAVLPGPPSLNLCRDAAARLAIGVDPEAVAPAARKRAVTLDRKAVAADPLPPTALHILDTHDGDEVLRRPAAGGLDRFRAVAGQLHGPQPRDEEGRAALFRLCAALARAVRVEGIARP